MRSKLAHMAALLVGATGAAGAAACRDRAAPLEPTFLSTTPATPPTSAAAVATATLSRWEIAGLTVDDARTRLVPALGPTAVSGAVGGTLTGLATAIGVADAAAIPSLLDAARQALDRYLENEGPSRRADVDAVRLALDAVVAAVATKNGDTKSK
ncbi:MAG: hypothetical protein K0S86_1472 [Geminicoccaceae bacterium]|nr:hypothetical protein [Geminicoccaceae bacterium]